MNAPKITTTFDPLSLYPHRDWIARYEDEPHRCGYGFGETEAEAIANLKSKDDRPKIMTSHDRLALFSSMEWVAFRDGDEERGIYGYGHTEAEAIKALLEMEDEE
jgi:hypothetical protein